MGTRHLIAVVKNNEYKVAQYGQWDGYPTGQGVSVLKFLKENDLTKFSKQIDKCKFITDKSFFEKAYLELGIKSINGMIKIDDADKFKYKYPQLDRSIGSNVLSYLMNNDEILLLDDSEFAKDSSYCEWAYIIDLDKNIFEVYEGHNKTPLSKNERFYCWNLKDERGYHPVKCVISFDLNLLPSKEEFLKCFDED